MFPRLSHTAACISAPFLLKAEYYSCMNRSYLLIHSSVDRYLACFPLLPIMNNAATNVCVQLFVWTPIFILLGINPGVELLGQEKAMAPHSSTLAWEIPWAEEPGGLLSMGSHRVGHNWSDFTFTFCFPALQKEMATHSSVLTWRIPGTGEPGGLLSMGSHRVGHDWSNLQYSWNPGSSAHGSKLYFLI